MRNQFHPQHLSGDSRALPRRLASFTPPLCAPAAWICALTTTVRKPVLSRLGTPRRRARDDTARTGTPNFFSNSFP